MSCEGLHVCSIPERREVERTLKGSGRPAQRVVYLTGAPGIGKSTTAAALGAACGARVLSYGTLLTERTAAFSQEELRERSSEVIAPDHVQALDEEMIALVANAGSDCIIDSHALTVETWGLRAIPFDAMTLSRIGISAIVCLNLDEDRLRRRVLADPRGRRILAASELRALQHLQASLALTYAHTLGVPFHLLDAAVSSDLVARRLAALCDLKWRGDADDGD